MKDYKLKDLHASHTPTSKVLRRMPRAEGQDVSCPRARVHPAKALPICARLRQQRRPHLFHLHLLVPLIARQLR